MKFCNRLVLDRVDTRMGREVVQQAPPRLGRPQHLARYTASPSRACAVRVSAGATIDRHVRQEGDVDWNSRDEDAMHAVLSEIIQCLK